MELADWAMPAMLTVAAVFGVVLLLLIHETRRQTREAREQTRELHGLRALLHEMEGKESRLLGTLTVISTKLAHLDALAASFQETIAEQKGMHEALSELSTTVQDRDAKAAIVYDEVDRFLRSDEVVGLSRSIASNTASAVTTED